MISVNVIKDSITGSYSIVQEGKLVNVNYGITYDESKYKLMKDLELAAASAESMADYNDIVTAFAELAKEDFSETVATITPYIHINKSTGKFHLKLGDKVSPFAIPNSFVDRIITSIEKGIDILPLIKFWVRLLRNPNFTEKKAQLVCNYIANTYVDMNLALTLVKEHGVSEAVAIERATSLQTPITQEGLLCTYKVSEEIKSKYELDEDGNKVEVPRYSVTKTIDPDTGEVTETTSTPEYVEDRLFKPAIMGNRGDKFYCGNTLGHFIKVGQKHSLESWSQVNTNDNQSCVPGLHVGNLDYIRGYQHSGTETHNTFVDPMYIGAVTNDGSGALRVKEYFTHSSFAGVNKSIYHSSMYAAITDAEFKEMVEEAIADSFSVLEEMQENNNTKIDQIHMISNIDNIK
jgi:hypothetical protein